MPCLHSLIKIAITRGEMAWMRNSSELEHKLIIHETWRKAPNIFFSILSRMCIRVSLCRDVRNPSNAKLNGNNVGDSILCPAPKLVYVELFDEFFNETSTIKLMVLWIFQRIRALHSQTVDRTNGWRKNKRIRLLVSTFLFCLKFSSYSFCIIVSRYPSRHCSPFSTVYALISHSNVWVWESVFLVCFLNVATFRVRLMYCNIFFSFYFICLVFVCFFFSLSSRFDYYMNLHTLWRTFWALLPKKVKNTRTTPNKRSTSFTNDTLNNAIWLCIL